MSRLVAALAVGALVLTTPLSYLGDGGMPLITPVEDGCTIADLVAIDPDGQVIDRCPPPVCFGERWYILGDEDNPPPNPGEPVDKLACWPY